MASRLMPSYDAYDDGAANGTTVTLLMSAGDEDEELKSPSNSLTSSPVSSVLQTLPSNADIDGPDGAKDHADWGVTAMDPAKIKVTLDKHGHPVFVSTAQW